MALLVARRSTSGPRAVTRTTRMAATMPLDRDVIGASSHSAATPRPTSTSLAPRRRLKRPAYAPSEAGLTALRLRSTSCSKVSVVMMAVICTAW